MLLNMQKLHHFVEKCDILRGVLNIIPVEFGNHDLARKPVIVRYSAFVPANDEMLKQLARYLLFLDCSRASESLQGVSEMSRICEECRVMMRLSKRLKSGAEMHSCPRCGKTWIREDTIIKKTPKALSYSASVSR